MSDTETTARARYVRCMKELVAKQKELIDALAAADAARATIVAPDKDDVLIATFDLHRELFRSTLTRHADAILGAAPLLSTFSNHRTEA